jgi:hypothetical protein
MASTINATTSGVVTTGDSVATLSLQTGGTTAVAIDTAQIVTLSKSLALLGSTSGSVALAAPATAGTQSYTLPTAQPTADGFALTSTKAGTMSWAAASATPGGSTTQVQYNNGGVFAGSANITTDGTTLTAAGFSGPLNGTVGATTANTGTFSSTVHKGSSSGTVTLTAPAVAGTQSYTLPTAQPTADGQALTSTKVGVMSWATAGGGGGSPGGSNTQVQYNNSGAFGGISGFTTDGTRVTASTTIGVGAATPSTSGSGITFPATQSSSTDVNTLDDYEEGTWTPSIGGSATYNSQWGSYTKVGRVVTCQFWISVNAIGSGSATTITGLPFSISNPTYANDISGGPVTYFASSATSVFTLNIRGSGGGTSLFFSGTTLTSTTINNSVSVFQNSAVVQASIIYETAT